MTSVRPVDPSRSAPPASAVTLVSSAASAEPAVRTCGVSATAEQGEPPRGARGRTPGDKPLVDILRWPLVGRFLRWRWARTAMQIPVLLLSLIMIAHAF